MFEQIFEHEGTGSNRRYPAHAIRVADERELREARKCGPLQFLSREQLELATKPLTVVPEHSRLTARAWLRSRDVDVRATVRVLRWTDDAVGVGVTIDGEQLRCWVWCGACTPVSIDA